MARTKQPPRRRSRTIPTPGAGDPMPPSERTRLFTRLCGIGFAAHLAYNLARDPVLSLWARSLDFSPAMVGVLMGASTFTGVLTKLVWGALSDSYGRRRLLLLATAVTAFVPILYFLGESYP